MTCAINVIIIVYQDLRTCEILNLNENMIASSVLRNLISRSVHGSFAGLGGQESLAGPGRRSFIQFLGSSQGVKMTLSM